MTGKTRKQNDFFQPSVWQILYNFSNLVKEINLLPRIENLGLREHKFGLDLTISIQDPLNNADFNKCRS